MTALRFECLDAESDQYAVGPTVRFKLKVVNRTPDRVHSIALRIQIRMEPRRRRYSPEESAKLGDLFGDPSRYAETLNPMQLAEIGIMVPSFTGEIEVPVDMPLTYDMEVASTKYFHNLDDGDVPLLMLFSGTIFYSTDAGVQFGQVPWHEEAEYKLPVAIWKEAMEQHFGGRAWILLRKDKLDALAAYRSERTIPSWEETVERLLKEAGVDG
ncbi:MAG: hypothetical protein H0W01_11750 [Pseudonocardiales bacterium]|nr:hypothetical protein [Pseudonocardiales bacterium]